ncbi:aminopeptidase NAALADL1-like [Dermacentor andersoni]|uniref:aminopeptidase NAALADL1-like n=1 Tax=Dermacentor andersoni TaxID=34620 RepID=UPI0021555266|nr:aminopeptidase NAALADL1-like [Dermacentor andersoni]
MTDAKKSTTDKPVQAPSGRKACAAVTLAVLATGAVFLLVGRYVVPSNWPSGCSTASGAPRSAAAAPARGDSADAGSEQRTPPPATDASARCANNTRGSDGFVGLESAYREVDTDLLTEAIVDKTLDEHVQFLAKEPHVAGSPRDEQVLAQYVADRLTEYGFDEVTIQPYHVLLSYPNATDPNSVQLLNGTTGEVLLDAAAHEKPVEGLDTDIGPAFFAYSPPGDVMGCLVYVNRATHEDLDEVEALNVSVTGCLCLARHGGTTLASKAYTCARKGAVGLLVFPDSRPSDATSSTSTHMFPSGPEMPETVLRRDSMMKVGDPLTPGVPAIPSAERMDPAFAGLPPIPSQPISYLDAQLLLRSLEGPKAPERFQLTGNVTYRLGDASADRLVRLRVNNIFTLAQINNVIATLHGSVEPDRYVVVGAQRDSFGFGALQPAPNTASLLALGHALGSLKKRGVRPRRSVLLCSWAAGEYGQVGSTEWVEQHLFELHSRAVAYIDISECASGGRLVPKACPSLENLAVEATKRVRDPADANRTMYDVWQEQWSKSLGKKASLSVRPAVMDATSDNAPFSLYAGVPSTSFLLKPEKSKDTSEVSYPAHHTAYDTLRLYNNWTDARLAPLCARLHGAALWLAADAPLIPVNFSAFALRLEESLEELRKSPSALELELNGVSLDALRLAIERFRRAADQWTAHLTQLNKTRTSELRAINDQMSLAEHTMLKPTGLPGRPLTRHVLWAPSEFDARRVTGFPVFADLLFYISQLPAETREHGWKNVRFYLADVLVALRASAAALRVPSL